MAGALTIDTLKASSGVLATQNGMTGIAKAWAQWVGSSGSIIASFNVSSVTRNSTGYWTVNLTTAMPSANYSATAGCCSNPSFSIQIPLVFFSPSANNYIAPRAGAYEVATCESAGTGRDAQYITSAAFSS